MLRSEHSIVEYNRGWAVPDRLMQNAHRHYVTYAKQMIGVYERGVGKTRRELHRLVRAILADEADCERRRIAAFCKLLDDAGEFDADRRGEAAKLRLRVFALAAKMHPLVVEPDQIFERSEAEAKALVAADVGRPWEELDAALYADVIDNQRLRSFNGFESAEALLSRYNLAQLQTCLYRARRVTVHASADFAAIVRWAKLARLLVETRRVGEREYRIELSGPASVLHETRRYGVNFARFVAALVSCRGWAMTAGVITPWGAAAEMRVTAADGYRSHVSAPEEFDSSVEEALAGKWGEARDGWRLHRDAGILQSGQTTFVPDFRLKHEDGREVLLEIVGFWTPQYLEEKRRTIAAFRDRRIVLAVPRKTANVEAGVGLIVYKTRVRPEDVVAAVEAMS